MGLYDAGVGQFLIFGARSGASAGQLSSYVAGAGAMFLVLVPVNIRMLVPLPVPVFDPC